MSHWTLSTSLFHDHQPLAASLNTFITWQYNWQTVKHLLLLDAPGGVVNIGGAVKPAGRGVVLHCAEQYPHTASTITTANMILAPAGAEQFKHYAFTTMHAVLGLWSIFYYKINPKMFILTRVNCMLLMQVFWNNFPCNDSTNVHTLECKQQALTYTHIEKWRHGTHYPILLYQQYWTLAQTHTHARTHTHTHTHRHTHHITSQ